MSHLYEDKAGVIHSCESSQMIPGNKGTVLVWTKCNKDVPANKSFTSREFISCPECKGITH